MDIARQGRWVAGLSRWIRDYRKLNNRSEAH